MKKSAFIFDDVSLTPDRQIGLHSYDNYELSYVLTGSGSRTIGEHTEQFRPGEIILIPPNIPHVWRFDPADTDEDGNIANISVYFDTPTLESLRVILPELTDVIARIEELDHAVSYKGEKLEAIRKLLLDMRGKTPEDRMPLMMKLLIEVSDISGSIYAGRENTLTRTERRLESVRVYCACNYNRRITLDEISRHAGMNKSAFCTFMRNNAGASFSEYLNGIRLERAQVMLRNTDRSISEIAMECGFQSVTYFNRLYRRKYRRTPKETRNGES